MPIAAFLLAMLSTAPAPVIAPRHPLAASPWVQSVRASCGRDVLVVDGYGGGRPLSRVATLRVNGRNVTGQDIGRLLGDLSHQRAVYRIAVLCNDPGQITLRINEGERQEPGGVRYWASEAFIRNGRLVFYTARQEGEADSFWFR